MLCDLDVSLLDQETQNVSVSMSTSIDNGFIHALLTRSHLLHTFLCQSLGNDSPLPSSPLSHACSNNSSPSVPAIIMGIQNTIIKTATLECDKIGQ